MRKRLLWGLVPVPAQVEAQEKAGRMILEAGLVGGSGGACPGRYAGIKGPIAGPASPYGMVETCRCSDFAGSANRIGTSVRLGRERWFFRPALCAGVECDGGDVSPTAGASLTFGRRCGVRFILHIGEVSGGTLTLFRMGGYVSFRALHDRPRGDCFGARAQPSAERGLDGLPAGTAGTTATRAATCGAPARAHGRGDSMHMPPDVDVHAR